MKVSYQWLREWTTSRLDAQTLARRLTAAGIEIGAVAPVAPPTSGVVVGKVRSVAPHPGAARLTVCDVEVGRGTTMRVVCGAPNVAAGMKAALALPGAVLAGDRRIDAVEVHGVKSDGMLCSADELGLDAEAEGLLALDPEQRVGVPLVEALKLDDVTLDVELTPNRGDCLSVAGIAREVAAITGSRLVPVAIRKNRVRARDRLNVKLAAKRDCPRYTGRVVVGLNRNAVTPSWMRERLRRAGVRSLHPVVDITNYVMLELGQPMHAFDLRKLRGSIRVHTATGSELLTLLDGQELAPPAGSLLIADGSGPVALAGIMGGKATAVGADTDGVFLESAFFSPESIAYHARTLGIHTESSHRFERGVDPELQIRALERATALLLKIAGGSAGPITEAAVRRRPPAPIAVRARRIERVIGDPIPKEKVARALKALAMAAKPNREGWRVTPPSYRFDIRIEEDLIEEIARINGYENVPVRRPSMATQPPDAREAWVSPARLRALLASRDYQEVITYSFVDPALDRTINPSASALMLANPISAEMTAMRTSLWPGLLQALQYNRNRQQQRIRIFEIGRRFADGGARWIEEAVFSGAATGLADDEQWGLSKRPVDFHDVKGDVEALLAAGGKWDEFRFDAERHPALHPGQTAAIYLGDEKVGWLGALHPGLQARLELGAAVLFEIKLAALTEGRIPTYNAISRFPAIRRDLAIVVSEETGAAAIVDAIKEVAGKLLVNLQLFDVYRGEGIDSGRKSLALGLTLQDSSRTLREAEVDTLMTRVVSTLRDQLGGELRR